MMKNQSNQDVVKFQGVDILTFSENDQHLIAIKPLCESFGIAWQPQHRKLNSDDLFSSTITMTPTVGADGKMREMTCLPLEVFPMWLARIHTSRVENPHAARTILAFQKEGTKVLYEHFMGSRYATTPAAVRKMVRQELAKERLAEYVYNSPVWTEDRLKRLYEIKQLPIPEPLTNAELGRIFDCCGSTIRKAKRLTRRAEGDLEDKTPESLRSEGVPQLLLFENRKTIPASPDEKADVWRMRAKQHLSFDEIAYRSGFSSAACSMLFKNEAKRREVNHA